MTENYDNNIYNEPYCVKDGCLYETVERKGKVTVVRLCDCKKLRRHYDMGAHAGRKG